MECVILIDSRSCVCYLLLATLASVVRVLRRSTDNNIASISLVVHVVCVSACSFLSCLMVVKAMLAADDMLRYLRLCACCWLYEAVRL